MRSKKTGRQNSCTFVDPNPNPNPIAERRLDKTGESRIQQTGFTNYARTGEGRGEVGVESTAVISGFLCRSNVESTFEKGKETVFL